MGALLKERPALAALPSALVFTEDGAGRAVAVLREVLAEVAAGVA